MKFVGNASTLNVKAGTRGTSTRDRTTTVIKVCIILSV
jgi:hypothetical protein